MSPYKIPLDLLPFGEIENQNKVSIHGKGLVAINLEGLSDVYEHGLVDVAIEGSQLKVCSISSVVLLKLIAYDDRPENRPKDPTDIASIIRHYPSIEMEFIWGNYEFLYEEDKENLNSKEIGIRVLGYEIAKIILHNSSLTKRVFKILDKAIHSKSALAKLMIQDPENETIASITKNLVVLKNGIVGGLERFKEK